MKVSSRVRISGPLASFAEGFGAELTAQGYTDLSLANQLRLMADLSRWLEAGGVEPNALTIQVVAGFVAKRRRTHTQFISERAVAPLLRYLRQIGSVPTWVPTEEPRTELLAAYEKYLVQDRSVTATRRQYYLAQAAEFLEGREAAAMTAAEVTEFVGARSTRPDLPASLTALRSVLRFLVLSGYTSAGLLYAVPSAPRWRLASLPKALEGAQVEAVLATCDRRTTVGRRNYAALLLMVRLGLRAGEVAALALDDIDWEAGEIVVHGKGGTIGRLPLPLDVGEATAAYLRRRRPRAESRSVLLQSRAPYRGATAGMVSGIAGSALRAAGISVGGAHRLRHTAATQMLRRGASLTEIAQVLRHRHVDTTAIYAKVDRNQLRSIAQPWPDDDLVDLDSLRELAPAWPGGAS
jgi:integrase/recombinase XerD